MNKLMIGWSEADITPDSLGKPIPLYGQYYARIAKGIHSRLKTVCVAMSSGEDFFIEASLDNVGCAQQFVDLVREKIAILDPSIDTSKVFFNAIHTHSAPSFAFKQSNGVAAQSWDEVSKQEQPLTPEEYAPFCADIVAKNVIKAWNSRKPGGIASAFGFARIGHCRRAVFANGVAEMYGDTTRQDFIAMEAGEDSGIEMLFTFDEQGHRTGMLLNVACPSQVMESTYVVSSDFAGATRELLKKEYGENFHTVYQISPAGCQSPRDLVRHYTTEPDFWHPDGVPVIAERLLNAVKNAVPGKIDYEPVFKSVTREVSLPRRRASYTDYKKAVQELDELIKKQSENDAFNDFCRVTHEHEKLDGPGPYDDKEMHFVQIKNRQAVIKRYNDQNDNPCFLFKMNVVRIGNIAIANNPFELYLYYGQNIKARSKAFQNFLVQLSGGGNFHAGYLPSPDAEKFAGYGGMIINGQCGSEGGYRLADVTVEEINKLFE